MKSLLISRLVTLILLIVLLIGQAQSATKSYAFTTADLLAEESDFAAFELLMGNIVSTPDINFYANGSVMTEMQFDNKGNIDVSSGIFTWTDNLGGLGGMTLYSSTFSDSGATQVDTTLSGSMLTSFKGSVNPYAVSTTLMGAVLSSPGTDEDYSVEMNAGYLTQTNAHLSDVPMSMIYPVEVNITMEIDTLEMEQAADLFDQDVALSFGVVGDSLSYYYDFSRTLEMDDTSCSSSMQLFKGEADAS